MTDEAPGEPVRDWEGYIRWSSGRTVRPLLTRVLNEYGEVSRGATAVDLGCGDGTETRALLDAGFAVTAVDAAAGSIQRLRGMPEHGTSLATVHSPMQDAPLPEADLVYAGYSLPFCPPERFPAFWQRLVSAVRPGGLLACDLFGDRDTWSGASDMTFVTRDQVAGLVERLELRSLHEIEEEGRAYSGPKHWHTFQVVARRPVVA
jgi:trans-aconitate methyltransferase